jgi:hypothetical protein
MFAALLGAGAGFSPKNARRNSGDTRTFVKGGPFLAPIMPSFSAN